MIVLLPFPDFTTSTEFLKPAWKEHVLWTIYLSLDAKESRYHFPWRYHEHQLACYGLMILEEIEGKIRTNLLKQTFPKILETLTRVKKASLNLGTPEWVGDEEIHASHRAVASRPFTHAHKTYDKLVIYPRLNLTKRFKDLQPLIQQGGLK